MFYSGFTARRLIVNNFKLHIIDDNPAAKVVFFEENVSIPFQHLVQT